MNYMDLIGTIPSEISKLSRLITLSIGDSPGLSGSIPEEMFDGLTNLVMFGFQGLSLTGTISTRIGLLSHLDTLFLEENELVR